MATRFQAGRSDRYKGAALAIAVQAVIGYVLVTGLGVPVVRIANDGLKMFAVAPPAPPPPPDSPPPPRVRSNKAEGKASPPNLRSKATPVTAPPPAVVLPRPPVIIAAPRPATGSEATSGAADIAGPGTGAGGFGNGSGGGREGNGDGEGDYTPPERIRGSISDDGYPRAAMEEGAGGTVSVRYVVDTEGRVPSCRVTRSSGNAALDAWTCRVIQRRFRFRPSLDPDGRAVSSQVVEDEHWDIERLPPDDR